MRNRTVLLLHPLTLGTTCYTNTPLWHTPLRYGVAGEVCVIDADCAQGGAQLHRAIDCYHTALAMRPDDTFCSEMLSRALRDVADLPEDLADDPRGSIGLRAERRLGYLEEDEEDAMSHG